MTILLVHLIMVRDTLSELHAAPLDASLFYMALRVDHVTCEQLCI